MHVLRRDPDQPRSRHGAAVGVKVITYAPTAFAHCQHCEVTFDQLGLAERIRREAASSALPEALATEYAGVSEWIRKIVDRHGTRVHLEIIDAASIEGVIASVRHRIGRYPAVVVDGHRPVVGTDLAAAEPLIESGLARLHPSATADGSHEGLASSGFR